MKSAIYITRNSVIDHIVNYPQFKNLTLTTFSAWAPIDRHERRFDAVLAKLLSQVSGRSIQYVKNMNVVKIRHFGLIEFLEFISRKLKIAKLHKYMLQRLEDYLIVEISNIFRVNKFDFYIITDDFLEYIPRNMLDKIYLELRGIEGFVEISDYRNSFFQKYGLVELGVSKDRFKLVTKLLESQQKVRILCYSVFVAQKIKAEFNVTPLVVPLSIPSYLSLDMKWESRRQDILFVGRDDQYKGLDFAIEIAIESKVQLHIVGTFNIQNILKLKNMDFVIFHGQISKRQLFKLMSKTKILISPSIETFGYTILEAIFSGMTPIISQYTGISEVLPDVLAVKMVDFDVSKWVEVVKKIEQTPLLQLQSRHHIQQFIEGASI